MRGRIQPIAIQSVFGRKVIVDSILQKAFDLPAAILIRNDLRRFEDPADVAYEIGVQQLRQHRRFANFFRHGKTLMMYFKHEPEEAKELCEKYPEIVLPSEIATKYWSKIWVHQEPELAQRLLETSYRLVCAACTKQGRKLVEESASEPNRFLVFHREALRLVQRDNIYLKYTDYDEPMLLAAIHAVAKFSWNKLSVRIPGAKGGWETLDGARFAEWPGAMQSSVE